MSFINADWIKWQTLRKYIFNDGKFQFHFFSLLMSAFLIE